MDASGERGERGERGDRAGRAADRTGRGSAAVRRWAVTGGWLCAIVLAVLVGAWSFQNANPDAGYESHGPLDESDVREELDGGGAGVPGAEEGPGGAGPSPRPPGGRPSAPPSSAPAGPPDAPEDGADDAPDAPGPKPPPDRGARPVPLEVPGGGATGTVQCLDDGRIRLTGLSPADGYRVDDVVHGPGRLVSFELRPPDDGDDGEDAEDRAGGEGGGHAAVRAAAVAKGPEDRIVSVRCRGGEPVASVSEES